MGDGGWIKLHRKLFDHWLWDNKPKTKFEAWIWIIQKANHNGARILLGNDLIDVERGQFVTSELKLMDRFKWSKTKLRNFLKVLEKDNMIEIKRDTKKTTLTVRNYEVYQGRETTEKPEKDRKKTTKKHQKDTNNNDKNLKNEENDKIEHIVDYLNKKLGTNFKPKSSKTVSCITARLNEGYTGNDFKTVIDKKIDDWEGTEHAKFLRPETLFGNKFDGYLNQVDDSKKQNDNGKSAAQKSIEETNAYINS